MEYNLFSNLHYCKDIVDGLLGFILYSHLPSAAIALIVSGYVVYKTKSLSGRILFALAGVFSLWVVLDLSIWLNYSKASALMAAWSALGFLSALMFVLVFYLIYVLVFERDMPRWMFVGWALLLAPLLFFSATGANLIGFDIRDCVAVENTLFTNYYYGIGVLVFLLIPIIGYRGRTHGSRASRAGIPMTIAGAELFLLAFFTTGVLAQYLVGQGFISDFGLEQYGILAMAVFMTFLAYTIVRYNEFNIKLIATQALVIAISILIATEFVFVQSTINAVLVGVTLAFALMAGLLLVRSVKREIEQREHIEKLAGELAQTNERQEGLIHFIGHEVKGFLTKDAGALAALSEGDLGVVSEKTKSFIDQALVETRRGVDSVSTILKASNLKKGTVAYEKAPFDLKSLVEEAIERVKYVAEKKGLALTLVASEGVYQMVGDKTQIHDHVLRNMIDNAINYTPSGAIEVSLAREGSRLVLTAKDTGVGISFEDKKHLFTEGGHGKDSQKVNAHSTGYGLFIAKEITEAHGGTIRAESEGPGKGSTFVLEFPAFAPTSVPATV